MANPLFTITGVLLGASIVSAQTTASSLEAVDLATVNRIKSEAFQNSKVMEDMFYLADVNGPRLTGSPGYWSAANWAVTRLREMGLRNAHLEKWGPFGRGWTYTRYEGSLLEPSYSPLIGFPMAWTNGTNGPVTGEPVIAVLKTEADLEKFKGKLKGKIVLIDEMRAVALSTTALATRLGENDLEKVANIEDVPDGGGNLDGLTQEQFDRIKKARLFNRALLKFLESEQPSLLLKESYNGDGGTVFASAFGSREEKYPVPPPTIALTAENYDRIYRLVDKKIPVKVRFEVDAKILTEDPYSYNVVAEIPGTTKRDEVVMLGGHLDSWHGGTGATDNAAGSAVALEAVRILTALGVKPERTIRIALWSGEEEGLLGSKAYVKEHFADPEVMKVTAEHAKLAAYFNLDNGSGKIRGVYLQDNDMVRPIFEAWLQPFRDLGARTLSERNTGGTDHLSFNAVGLPGFQFIQDPLEYGTRTHHSNMDVVDHVQAADLRQASAIMASFVYNAAMRPAMLPRKALPKAHPGLDKLLGIDEDEKKPAVKQTTQGAQPTVGASGN